MIARVSIWKLSRIVALGMALAAGSWSASSSRAGELDKLDTSLKWIPADAAFYSSCMRAREQFDAVAASNAWAKIKALPAVQEGLSKYQEELKNPDSRPANFEKTINNPEIRKVIDLLIDIASTEVFIYGDSSCTDFVEFMQNFSNAMNFGQIKMQASGEAEDLSPGQIQGRAILSAMAKNVDLMGAPGLVCGFKLKTPDLAKEQLIKLEMLANIVLETNVYTKGHFKKKKVGDYDFLVLELDGGMVPLDNLPLVLLKSMETEEGDAEKIIDRLKEMTLSLALGVRGDYLLFSIGSSLDCLEKLGQGDRLVDRPEFKRIEPLAARRLVSIGYVSEEMARQWNNQKKNLDNLLDLAEAMIPKAELEEAQEERILTDAEAFAEDLKQMMPEAGAILGASFLTDRGIEGYQYDWGRNDRLDGSQRLGLLAHLGGNPILAVTGRSKVNLKEYDLIVKWIEKGYGYFREYALPNMQESERNKTAKFLDAAVPLAVRMDKANRECLFPALADGQAAFVIDGKFASKRLVESMPNFEKPMPWPEPAIVVGVSDAKLLKKGLGEYREIVNGLLDAVRGIEGSDVPDWVRIPEPKETEGASGTIYSFTLPKEWGVDGRVVPNLGLSDRAAAFSASPPHTERLLKATPLAAGGVLEKTDGPRAMAVWLDWAGLVDAAAPWADYAVDQAAAAQGFDEKKKQSVSDQVRVGLKALKTIRSLSIESYREDDVLVHHSMLEIRDVEK